MSPLERNFPTIHATTIVAARKGDDGAIAGDGQVTFGEATVIKHRAKKVRTLAGGKVLAGFAGSAADAFTLFEKFEEKLTAFQGNLLRAAVELAKEWRSDRILRRLEALLVVMDAKSLLVISGNGDVIEPDDGVVAIGSGGPFAMAVAKALIRHTNLPPHEIVKEALLLASEICIYTNDHITVERLGADSKR